MASNETWTLASTIFVKTYLVSVVNENGATVCYCEAGQAPAIIADHAAALRVKELEAALTDSWEGFAKLQAGEIRPDHPGIDSMMLRISNLLASLSATSEAVQG